MKNPFKLPTPIELGVSNSDALTSRAITPFQEGYSWEDYNRDVKKAHPVLFSLHSIYNFLNHSILGNIKYYFYNFTSKYYYKHNMLNLNQPISKISDEDNYQFGKLDHSSQMLYAIFNVLSSFVEDVTGRYSVYCLTNENYLDHIVEAKEIHYWWSVTRKQDYRDIHIKYDDLKDAKTKEERASIYSQIHHMQEFQEKKLLEMTIRIMKIRSKLWI